MLLVIAGLAISGALILRNALRKPVTTDAVETTPAETVPATTTT
jgi:hypothetical protein